MARHTQKIRSLSRRTRRVRAVGLLVQARPGLRPADVDPTADDVRDCGFTCRPGCLDTRPRRTQLRSHCTRLRWAVRGSHARRCPRQHHALLVDEHGGLLGSYLLGKQVCLLCPETRRIPTAFSAFPDEVFQAPRSWAEQAYPKLVYYKKHEKDGHFAAWEQPELYSEDVRAGFRPVRK